MRGTNRVVLPDPGRESLGYLHHLPAGPRGQGGLRTVGEGLNGAVREDEIRPAGVQAPEMKNVADVVAPAGAELVGAEGGQSGA